MEEDATVTGQSVGSLSHNAAETIANLLAKGYTEDRCQVVSDNGSKLGSCPDTTGMIGGSPACFGRRSCFTPYLLQATLFPQTHLLHTPPA